MPLIDARSYADIVRETEALAAEFTALELEPASPELRGQTLSEAVLDPVTQQVIATAGAVVDAALADQLSRVPGLDFVKVRGWQPAIVTTVPPTPETLRGHILHQDIRDNLSQKLLFPSGKFIDATLAQQISQISGLGPVEVMTGPDAGQALINLFAHFTRLVLDRLNRAPDKNFLAFLDLIGTRLLPPQPSRVPLTFRLASGSPVEAFVPAFTPVASPPTEGEEEETVFETERDLVVTRSQLVAVIVRDADRDNYADYTDRATGVVDAVFPAIEVEAEASQLVEHSLYLTHARFLSLPNLKKLTFTLNSPDEVRLAALPISWSFWNGQAWQSLSAQTVQAEKGQWKVAINNPPALKPREVNEHLATWLQARFEAALPQDRVNVVDNLPRQIRREDFKPDAALVRRVPVDPGAPFFPFGDKEPLNRSFSLNIEEAFLRGGALVTLKVQLVAPVAASNDLVLDWKYKDGTQSPALGSSGSAPTMVGATNFSFSDGTLGLTRSGEISFRVPPNWSQENLGGRTARWLTVESRSGAYRQVPQIQAITVSYTWELPRLGQLTLAAETGQDNLVPELAFANGNRVDLSMDFYPLGERPRFNDTLYLGHSAALAQPGATVTLDVTLSNPSTAASSPITKVAARSVVLAWEVWDGRVWQVVGQSGAGATAPNPNTFNFGDATNGLTVNGQVKFNLPTALGPGSVNSETNAWLRVRLVRGDYGQDAYYVQDTNNKTTVVASTLAPPSIQKVLLGYTAKPPAEALAGCYSYNDFAYADCTGPAADGKTAFLPFTPTRDTQPALYLGFDRPFANRPMALYARVEAPLPEEVMAGIRRNVVAPPAPRLVWEYSGPQGWARLGVQDETHTFAERGLVNFIGPADFTLQSQFGQPRYWLRARWTSGVFQVRPRLRRWLTNTVWAGQASTVRQEILGSSSGNADQVFTTSRAPVLLEQRLEVQERELPSAEELAELEVHAGREALTVVLDASGQADEIWVRWQEVPDFYASGPSDRHYTLDHLTGEIRFGDGQHGLAPPQGSNNIRLALYRTGGGALGDRSAGAITQLKSTVPYVDSVTNLEAAGGGADRESLESVKERGPRTLRHRGRAVTAQDFVDLAYEASPDVARAFAIVPESNPLELKWLDPKQTVYPEAFKIPDAGHIGLVIVPYSSDLQPIPSLDLINRVEAYIHERATPSLDLWVAGPDWSQVTVTVEVVPTSLSAGEGLGTAVLIALQRFLHPLTGGPEGEGWAFGRRPELSDFYAVIESLPGVDHLRALSFIEEPEPETPASGAVSGRFLVFSGAHIISVVSPEGDS